MEIISKALFWVANSLLIPDIILLLLFFGRSILLIGGVYNQFMIKRKTDKSLSERIKTLTPESLDTLREHIPSEVNSLFVVYLKDLLTSPSSEDYSITYCPNLKTKPKRPFAPYVIKNWSYFRTARYAYRDESRP